MRYAVPMALLALVPAAFFVAARGNFHAFGRTQRSLQIVAAAPLIVSAFGHFFRTATFASIVPPAFPDATAWVVLTGVLELAGAVGLLLPKTTKAAAVCVTLLMIAVFPANIYAAGETVGGLHMPSVSVRLTMQIVYVLLVLMAVWGVPASLRREPRLS